MMILTWLVLGPDVEGMLGHLQNKWWLISACDVYDFLLYPKTTINELQYQIKLNIKCIPNVTDICLYN